MDNFFGFLGAYYLIPSLIIGMIGFLLGWFLKPSKKQDGDLSVEGEGALRAEADSLRARVQDLEGRLSGRDSEVSELKTQLSANADASSGAATAGLTGKTTDTDDTYALEWQNRYLAARVKYLDSRLADMGAAEEAKPKAAAKPAAKKTVKPKAKKAKAAVSAAAVAAAAVTAVAPAKKAAAKKPAAKKAATKKSAAKKPAAKKTTAKASASKPAATKKAAPAKKAPAKKAPAKKAAATKKPSAKSTAKLNRYYENVKKYDGRASKDVVSNIVKYCGVSLASRDSSLVACSDETELQTVAKGFVTKKLGLKEGQMDLVKSVCEEMKAQRMKSRVTFYYLAARKVGKLDLFK